MTTNQDLAVEERPMVTMSFGDHIEDLRHHLLLALAGLFTRDRLDPDPALEPWAARHAADAGARPPNSESLLHCTASEKAAAARIAGSYTPIPVAFRPRPWPERYARFFPNCPPRCSALRGRYVEWPQELEDSSLIKVVDANVERNDALIALGPMEPAVIFCGVTLVTGLVLASPWVFYQIWAFIAAGLYRHERTFVYRFMPYSLGLFLAGVFLCFFGGAAAHAPFPARVRRLDWRQADAEPRRMDGFCNHPAFRFRPLLPNAPGDALPFTNRCVHSRRLSPSAGSRSSSSSSRRWC